MKFIIPQNYNFKNKIFGIVDYSTAIFNVCWYLLIFYLLKLFFSNWDIIIFLFISLCFPVTIFSFIGFNGEPFIYVLKYLIKFLLKPKLYLYKKY